MAHETDPPCLSRKLPRPPPISRRKSFKRVFRTRRSSTPSGIRMVFKEGSRSGSGTIMESPMASIPATRARWLRCPGKSGFQPFLHHDSKRFPEGVNHVDRNRVMVLSISYPINLSRLMSRYQLGTGFFLVSMAFIAFPLKEIGDTPGGQERHFWLPL